MKKCPIYLVRGVVCYEGNTVIRAFEDKGDAEALAEACREYDKLEPMWAPGVDTVEFNQSYDEWAKGRPDGDGGTSSYDHYDVVETELYTKEEE